MTVAGGTGAACGWLFVGPGASAAALFAGDAGGEDLVFGLSEVKV